MVEENSNSVRAEPRNPPRKRKPKRTGTGGAKKRMKALPKYQGTSKVKDNKKTRRLFRKRVREYNSDDEEGDSDEKASEDGDANEENPTSGDEEGHEDWDDDGDDEEKEEGSSDDDNDGEMQQGITKFTQGCRAFKMAFVKIMKKSPSADPLGPVLSAHKNLVAEKLAEELAEQKVKGEAKKEKHSIMEKGHVKPANFLDSKEKFLISVATKGVVKLFNAVNRAQHPQKGLNPSKFKDAKVLAKRRKEAFLSELRKPTGLADDDSLLPKDKSRDEENNDEPGWAPLRDSYFLTNPKLKDWDKMPDPASVSDSYRTPLESSDEE